MNTYMELVIEFPLAVVVVLRGDDTICVVCWIQPVILKMFT